jgi:ubiquinone/menaquinone biosynthesis C-methylase UbiE
MTVAGGDAYFSRMTHSQTSSLGKKNVPSTSSESGQVIASAAEIYERDLVPALFREWAPRVADAARISAGQCVLDVACGTGILAREVARRVGPDGSVAGVDPNAAMLTVARERAPDIEWHLAPAERLPFAAQSFDVVVCQFGLMFFDDRKAALAEMIRVVKPGGPVVVVVWDAIERSEGYSAFRRGLARLFGEAIARSIDAPFCLGDLPALDALVRDAFESDSDSDRAVRVESKMGTARFPSLGAWVQSEVRGWLLADKLDDDAVSRLTRVLASELGHLVRADESFCFGMPAHIVCSTGRG